MAVLEFKDSTLEKEIVAAGTESANGDFVPGSTSWGTPEKCDSVMSTGPARVLVNDDGQTVSYSYVVYLSPDCQDYSYGDNVRLTLRGNKKLVTTVKGFDRKQLQAKVYL